MVSILPYFCNKMITDDRICMYVLYQFEQTHASKSICTYVYLLGMLAVLHLNALFSLNTF